MSIKIMCQKVSTDGHGCLLANVSVVCTLHSFLKLILTPVECQSDDSSLSLLLLPSVVDIDGPCTLPFSDAWWVFLSPSLLSMLVQLWASTPRPS